MVKEKKIIFIGFNKTGTTSLHLSFKMAGYKSIHWDNGNLAKRIYSNFNLGNDLLDGYLQYQVYSDGFFLSDNLYLNIGKLYRQFLENDDYYLIYQFRDPYQYAISRLNHRRISIRKSFTRRFTTLFGPQNCIETYIKEESMLRAQLAEVGGTFSPGNKLFFLNMGTNSTLAELNDHLKCLGLDKLPELLNVNKSIQLTQT